MSRMISRDPFARTEVHKEVKMTRQDIEPEYDIDDQGRILNPGKFELEARYVPYFWERYLEGFADEDDGTVLTFNLTPTHRIIFPELAGRACVKLLETESGFVVECS